MARACMLIIIVPRTMVIYHLPYTPQNVLTASSKVEAEKETDLWVSDMNAIFSPGSPECERELLQT